MKLVTMVLVCLLLAAMWLQDVDSVSIQVPSSRCCYKFVKFLRQKPVCYKETSSSCSYKAVIFKLKGGTKVCASMTDLWVQGYLQKVKPCT